MTVEQAIANGFEIQVEEWGPRPRPYLVAAVLGQKGVLVEGRKRDPTKNARFKSKTLNERARLVIVPAEEGGLYEQTFFWFVFKRHRQLCVAQIRPLRMWGRLPDTYLTPINRALAEFREYRRWLDLDKPDEPYALN